MGEANAERMLGKEGWKPFALEAKEVGLIKEVVPHDRLLDRLCFSHHGYSPKLLAPHLVSTGVRSSAKNG